MIFDFIDENSPDIKLIDTERNPLTHEEQGYRISLCGSWQKEVSENTGKFYYFKYRCGLERAGCKLCRHRVGKRYQDRIQRAIGRGARVLKYRLPKDRVDEIRKSLGLNRTQYMRLPVEDDEDIFFLNVTDIDNIPDGGQELNGHNVQEMDWSSMIVGAGRRNKSGTLGKQLPASPKTDEKPIKIQVNVPIVDYNPEAERYAERMTYIDTMGLTVSPLSPTLKKDLTAAIALRYQTFERYFREAGGNIGIHLAKTLTVYPSKINWEIAPYIAEDEPLDHFVAGTTKPKPPD